MGTRIPRNNLTPEQLQVILASQSQAEPPADVFQSLMQPPVTAVPGTVEQMEPTYEIPEQSALETPVPETQQPEDVPASPSMVPGKTQAVADAKDAQSSDEPESDETEELFTQYGQTRKTAEEDLQKFEVERGESEVSRQRMTGIAGALQSFGEGLAAITGGSAKPLQAGVAAVKGMGEQQAAAEERKAKSLRERILQARQPLEQKAEEIKFRDVFEQRQLKKDLADPNSKQSEQARQLANNFLDAYIASVSNRIDETQLAKLEAIRPRLEKLNANQVNEFMDNLNKLKFTESKADIEAAKSERQTTQQAAKTTVSQEFKVQQKAQDRMRLINNEVAQDQKFYDQYKEFKSNLEKAVNGDQAAQNYIIRSMDAFSYLKSRTIESKGVFTDQDARRLDVLSKNSTWAEQFNAWLSRGLQGKIPIDTLKRLSEALKDEPLNPAQARNRKINEEIVLAEASDNPAIKNSANYFKRLINEDRTNVEPDKSNSNVVGEFNTEKEVQDAVDSGKIKLKPGDIIKVNGKLRIIE